MSVKAAVLREAGGVPQVEEIDLNAPGPRQVRVRLAACGVCHTDLSLANGRLQHAAPVVLGHEGAGVVVEIGEHVWGLDVGDHVVLNWSPPCRACWYCERGEPYLCEKADSSWRRPYGRLADGTDVYAGLGVGGFATETVIDEIACVRVPDDIPLAQAALLGCAVLTGVGAVRHAADVQPGESVVVIGLGGVGLAAIQGARIAGAGRIVGVDPSAEKLDLALRLGATDILPPSPTLSKEVRALCDGRGADHALECVGRADTIRAAWSSTRRGGKATVVGLGAATDQVSFSALELYYFARTLTGCVYGNTDAMADIPFLLDCYRAGSLDLAAMVTSTIALEDIGDAFGRLESGIGARSVILLDSPEPVDQGVVVVS